MSILAHFLHEHETDPKKVPALPQAKLSLLQHKKGLPRNRNKESPFLHSTVMIK